MTITLDLFCFLPPSTHAPKKFPSLLADLFTLIYIFLEVSTIKMANARTHSDEVDMKIKEHASQQPKLDDATIDPENEVTGIKLLLIHIGICLCTFLIGLVIVLAKLVVSHADLPVGLQCYCHGSSGYNDSFQLSR